MAILGAKGALSVLKKLAVKRGKQVDSFLLHCKESIFFVVLDSVSFPKLISQIPS
jgi:hypothetical protein